MSVEIRHTDLLKLDVAVIVNAWNRNIIPWWLLLPQGVSKHIKKHAGLGPFREVAKAGPIPLGGGVLTSAGKLDFEGIIHVAGINMLWRSSEQTIRRCACSIISIARHHRFDSIGVPLIGAGSGGMNAKRSLEALNDEFTKANDQIRYVIAVLDPKLIGDEQAA